jgi:hypothetical protein
MKSKLLCLLTLVLSVSVHAQAPRKAEASLQLLSGGEYIADYGYLQSNGQVRPIDISPDFLSARISYAGPARFEIRPISGAGSKKDDGPPLAWFDLPEGQGPHRLILIVTPRPGSNGISAINDSPGSTPFGSMRFFNACPYPVELLGERIRMRLGARSSALVKPDVKDGHYFDLDIVTHDGEPRNVFHLHQFHMIDARTLLFIEPDGPPGQARIKSVEERDIRPSGQPPKTPELVPPKKIGRERKPSGK